MHTNVYSPTATTFDKAHIATCRCVRATEAIEHGDADLAIQHTEAAIVALVGVVADYDITQIEVLPSRRCDDCGRDAIEFRILDGRVVCNLCERALDDDRNVLEHETDRLSREQVLEIARAVITDRRTRHGSPTVTFARIAHLWGALLCVEVRPEDVAICLAALKLIRASVEPKHGDNWIDLAGYGACGAEVAGAVHKKEVA